MDPFHKIRYQSEKFIFCCIRNLYKFNETKNLSFLILSRILSYKIVSPLIFITLILSASLYARENNIKFENISIDQGLSQSTVNCILQDYKGFMWFGTEDGLNKYDGYRFTVYKSDPLDSTSLSDSYIISIYEDREGVLWVGTEGGGLNKYDREKEKFTHYIHNPNNPNSLSHNYVSSIYEDKFGFLWVGTKDGLNKFNQEEGKFTHYKHDPNNTNSLSNSFINFIFEDGADFLWIGTEEGLNRFDREKEKFTHYRNDANDPNSLSNDRVLSIYEDKSGVLWIGTDNGLDKFDREKGEFAHYIHNPNSSNSLSNNFVRAIYEDRAGALWIGTYGGGLNRLDREKGSFAHWEHEPGNFNSLCNNFINSIYEDYIGMLWIGTFGGGLSRFDREKAKFMHYNHDPNNTNSLSANIIFSIYEDRLGVLWIGTYGGGFSKFDREKGKYTHYKHDPNNTNSLCNDNVRSICEDKVGMLWIGTYDGLDKFDQEREGFTHYIHNPHNPNSLSHDYVRIVYEDKAGLLWIGTYDGLDKFDREQERFTHYKHNPSNPDSLSHNYVRTIYEDRAGVLWVGTDGGLNRFDRQKEKFTHYRNDVNDPSSLSNDRVLSIYEDRLGVLRIGTYGGGLNRFDREKERFIHYREKEGLPNDVIYGILEDNKGNLWLSTNKGLSKFNPQTETFRNYDVKDGLQSDEFNSGAYHKSKGGEMFFGGINGFNAFYPDKIRDNPHIPPVVITDFQLFNKSILIGERKDGRSILKKSITETEEIELSYEDRVFSFEFAALHYASPERNRFAYMMEGFEKDWNYVGNRRFVTYTNLPPGDYVFRVKGSNNDGVWNEEGTSLRITITPPVWQTWWFRVLGIIAILLLFFFGHQFRTHNIRERSRQLENKVEERTAELNITNRELQQEITERKRVEEELRESEELFRSVVENSHNGILIVDDAYKFIYINDELCRILKYSSEEILDQDFRKFLDQESKELVADSYVRRQRGENVPPRYEFNVVRKDGEKRRVEISSTVVKDSKGKVKTVGQILDITERKKAEEALKASENRYRTLFEEVPVGLYRTMPDGRVLDVNLAMVQMVGFPDRKSLIETDAKDLYVKSEDREHWQDIIDREGVVFNFEHRLKRYNGTSICVLDTARAVFDAQKKVLFYEGSLQDITARKETEEKLKQTLAELERSNRELEQFAYAASHDLQEPLRMVSSYTQLLARRYKDKLNTDANEFITYAVDGAARMQILINGLLTYSRIGSHGKPFKETNCEIVLKNVLDNLKVVFEESKALITHDPLPTIMGDSSLFVLLFQNLIENAIKFRKKGVKPRIHISAEQTGDEWIFSVRDNGIGIDSQYKERIFTIFQRLHGKGEYSGTGIGLAICKKVVEFHGGGIRVDSKLGEGSVFYFTIPRKGGN